mmetsp:Transcript_20534/g.34997  ORF Transcript_20534/g.34997 Transcript_20534/m.34997 type:complete len:228 (+) Transcript_20534:2763-3446(+)
MGPAGTAEELGSFVTSPLPIKDKSIASSQQFPLTSLTIATPLSVATATESGARCEADNKAGTVIEASELLGNCILWHVCDSINMVFGGLPAAAFGDCGTLCSSEAAATLVRGADTTINSVASFDRHRHDNEDAGNGAQANPGTMLRGLDAHINDSGSFIVAYGGMIGGGRCDDAPGVAFTSASTNGMLHIFTNPPLYMAHLSTNARSSTSFFAAGELGANELNLKSR